MIANSKKHSLQNHSIAVANLVIKLFEKLNFSESSNIKITFENMKSFKESLFLAGLFHDIGKIDPNFQNFILNKQVTDYESKPLDGVHFLETKESEKFSFLNYPRHNELSWAISSKLFLNSRTMTNSLYGIYYHHAKVKRIDKGKEKNEWSANEIIEIAFENLSEVEKLCTSFIENILIEKACLMGYEKTIKNILNNVNNISTINIKISPPKFIFDQVSSSKYTADKDIVEIKNLLTRSLVVSADRIISSLSKEELDECIQDNYFDHLISSYTKDVNLSNAIENMLDRFILNNQNNPIGRERDEEQRKIALSLSDKNDTAVLFGPAGCGKTKIFLEWYKNKVLKNKDDENKKLYIIAPRKMICSSLFYELKDNYIPTAKIELITGDTKFFWDGQNLLDLEKINKNSNSLESEVVITTIDQLISIMLSHKNIDMLYEFLNSYVVFDEFHEFFNIPGIVLLFNFFIQLKNFKNNSKTLLVSATPNYYFLENILKIKTSSSLEYIDTFNKQEYNLALSVYQVNNNNQINDNDNANKNLLSSSIMYQKQKPGSILIFNTAVMAQRTSILVNGEDTICFHSKFTGEDKAIIYKKIKKEWNYKDPISDKVLRSGPILQASLNISTMNLMTELCSAENWCQRLGRCNRFASNLSIANFITVLSDKSLNGEILNNSEAKFLDRIGMKNQTFSWIEYLNNKYFINNEGGSEKEVRTNLSQIYQDYKEFHSLDLTKKAYEIDFQKIIEESIKIFDRNDFTPFEYWKSLKNKSKKNKKLSSLSIRNSSVFVLPTCYDVKTKTLGGWLYIPDENLEANKLLTIGEEELLRRGDVFNKQINLLSNTRISQFSYATYSSEKIYKKMNPFKLKLEAKTPTSPILLSYPESITNYQILNDKVLFYVSKGNLKIGLYEL